MLGNYIRVTIDPVFDSDLDSIAPRIVPSAPDGLRVLSGTAELSSSKNGANEARVFVITPIKLKGILKLRVIAVVTERSGRNETYIVAPDRVYVFEPTIRELLADKLSPDCEARCLHEKSCGAIVFRKRSGNHEFLLVKNKRGGNWGFPKGHIEIGENEFDTAKREVKEETGLDILPLEGFRVISEYHPRGRIYKQVVFFLAEMPDSGEVVPQQSEIDRYIWADYGLAMRTFRFNNDRSVLTQAKNWLKLS